MNMTYFPVLHITNAEGAFTVLAAGNGNFLVQNDDTKITTYTGDVYEVGDYVIGQLKQFVPHDEDTEFPSTRESAPATPGDAYIAAQEASHAPLITFEWNVPDSSLIQHVAQFETGAVQVTLQDGSCYQYANVPSGVVDRWTEARSAGAYYNSNIRGVYESTKLG